MTHYGEIFAHAYKYIFEDIELEEIDYTKLKHPNLREIFIRVPRHRPAFLNETNSKRATSKIFPLLHDIGYDGWGISLWYKRLSLLKVLGNKIREKSIPTAVISQIFHAGPMLKKACLKYLLKKHDIGDLLDAFDPVKASKTLRKNFVAFCPKNALERVETPAQALKFEKLHIDQPDEVCLKVMGKCRKFCKKYERRNGKPAKAKRKASTQDGQANKRTKHNEAVESIELD